MVLIRRKETHMSKQIHKKNIEMAQAEALKKREQIRAGKMRQRYHFMPETGWLNDPNGLIFYQGKYHYFYQYNPYDAHWGQMHWGHAVSDDLMHWEYLPVALAPSEPYDSHPEGGCFSGSAIEHEGCLYLIYTGTAHDGNGFVQTQCVAVSEDGVHFHKYEGNPVITAPEGIEAANFRDPKVWKHEDCFYLVCGGKKDDRGYALLYRSRDLLCWEFVNVMLESRGEWGTMFECPDFYSIEGKDVLMFSPMEAGERTSVYIVGELDYKTGVFLPEVSGEIDWGFDFYAPQSFLDPKGRRILVAWANGWSWMTWWKDWGPSYQEGWCGFFNLPRQVRLMSNHTLQFVPVEELKQLRGSQKRKYDVNVEKEAEDISGGDGVAFESRLVLDLEKTEADRIKLELRSDDRKKTVVIFDLKKGQLTVDRNHADGWSTGIGRCNFRVSGKKMLDIHIFSDQSSIEIFSSDYQVNFSCNVFASCSQNRNMVYAEGGRAFFSSIESFGIDV